MTHRVGTALVTGATGFVGSWLSRALLEQRANVVALVRDEVPGTNFAELGLERRVTIVRGSLTDEAVLRRALGEYSIDTVFHLAAQTIVGVANKSPLSTFEANIRGTWTLLEACREAGPKAIVIASSDKAYGAQPKLPYTEASPLLGRHPYDASKACADLLAQTYGHTYGLPVIVTRSANIYGGGDLNWSRIVPGTCRALFEGRRPIIRSDGTPLRDYVHVDDVVAAYLQLAECAGSLHHCAYNIGSGEPKSVLDVVGTLIKVSGNSALKADVQGKARPPGEIDEQWLDASRVRTELGWKPGLSLEAGLARTWGWYASYLGRRHAS